MEEEEGFEPPRDLTPLSVFKTDPFSQTWVFLRIRQELIYHERNMGVNTFADFFLKNFGKAVAKPLWQAVHASIHYIKCL